MKVSKFFNLFPLNLNAALVKSSTWLFAGGIASGIIGYLFQIIMGRMLSLEEYGLFSALIALTVVMRAPLGTFTMLISRKVSGYRVSQKIGDLTHLFFIVNIKGFLVASSLILFVLFFIDNIKIFLKVEDSEYIYLIAVLILLSFPEAINNAYLQGLQYFKWLSATYAMGSTLRTIVAVVLVWFGLGVSGALYGIIIATVIMFIFIYRILKPQLHSGKNSPHSNAHYILKSALPVLFANSVFILMTQLDMILVKYYFTEQEAGLYAAASILGKAVMYLPGSIAIALFPMVAENHVDGKSSINLLMQSVITTVLLCSVGALLYYFMGDFIISFLYGRDYQEAGKILKYYGFAILPMALVLVAEYYLIAMGQVLFAYLFAVIAPLQLLAIYLFHDELLHIVIIMGISGFLLVIIGYGMLWRAHTHNKGGI